MRIDHLAACAAIAVVLCGCPTTQQARDVETSGFLGDYSRLEEGGDDQALLRYENETADFSKYDKILIEPVQIWRNKESDLDEVSAEDQKALVDYLHTALVRELEKDYQIVDAAGPGTLRFRVALTDAEDSTVVLDTVSSILPVGLVISQLKNLATGSPSFVGGASVEAELTDAASGETLVQAVDRRVGGKSISGVTSSWSDVQEAFDAWAEGLRVFLAEKRTGR